MNEEKNNVGVNNSGLPPMNTVPTGSMPSQNMSVNNLPPMGSMPSAPVQPNSNAANIQEKYGLPPISNFTNFNNRYEAPKVDNNTSVFDLMDQFESVNNQNWVSSNNDTVVSGGEQVSNNNVTSDLNNSFVSNEQPEQISRVQNINNNQGMPNVNSLQPEINSVPNIAKGSVVNNNVENISMPSTPVLNQSEVNNTNVEPLNLFSGNNGIVSETPIENSTPVEINNQSTNNMNSMNVNPLDIFGGNVGVNETPVNNASLSNQVVTPNLTTPVLNNTQTENSIPFSNTVGVNSDNEVNSINRDTLDVNQSNNIGANQGNTNGFVTNTPDVINNSSIKDMNSVLVNTNVESVTNTPVVNQGQPQQDNTALNVPNNQIDENQINSVVEIPTTSLENTNNNENVNIDANDNPVNNLNTVTPDNSSVNTVEKPKKKKKSKLLFIILLIATILILSAVGVLSYFMFFKTDKLVCGFQDYSNEQYILDESMVFRFKGNKMTDAKLSQVLTFTEDNLDKKDSYLEELKNQYQGLGFNVSFVENEDGFEIDMDFTKSELESWYGTNLKNSSKTQMKKEMRDSGYTCK